MNMFSTRTLVAASLALGLSAFSVAPAQAQAQGSSLTRSQVKMDRDAFLAMARWDNSTDAWVLREDMPMPTGVPSRAEVKAMRDKFLSMHTWSGGDGGQWVPVGATPRDMSKLTREQVKAETIAFNKTHRFDEATSTWISRSR